MRRALALYREALNAQYGELVAYAVLGYYKIIELKYKQSTCKAWIRDKFSVVENERHMEELIRRLDAVCGGPSKRHEYLYEACRTAVAHANPKKVDPIDTDDLRQIREMHDAASVLRVLARHFIKMELGLVDSKFVQSG